MKRRMVLGILWAGIIAASVSYSQQGIYVEQLQSIDAVKNSIDLCAVSLKTNMLGVISSGGGVKLYDIPALKEKTILTSVPLHVNTLSFSGSGQTLVLGATDGNAYVFNINAPTDLKKLSPHSLGITSIAFLGENWLFSTGVDKKVIVTDVVNGTELGSLPDFQEDVTAIAVHPGAKHFTVGLSSGKIQVYAVAKLELQKTLVTGKDKISTICYSADGKFLAAGAIDGTVYLWDTQTSDLKLKYTQRGLISSVAFDPKSRWLISTAADSSLKFYDLTTLSAVKTMIDRDGCTTYAAFLNDEILLTSTSTGKLKSWKITSIPPDTTNPRIVLEHTADTTIAKVYGREYEIHGVVFDDSELKEAMFNGKPLMLSALTTNDTVKIPAGMKAFKHFSTVLKLDSVGMIPFEIKVADNANHSVSERRFVQRLSNDQAVEVESPLINSETESMSVPVKFKTWFDVASYSISVNMVDIVNGQIPEFKVAGDVIADEVPLVAGYNQIQLSIMSKSGDKFSKTIGINRKASVLGDAPIVSSGAKKERVKGSGPQHWAVVVGVSEYKNPGIPSLKYADKDAEALADFLRRPEGGGYDSDHMQVLLNKDATLTNLKAALITFLNQAIDMDLVIIYFAGHGAPEPAKPSNTYLLTYDTDPNSLGTSAFPMWDIETVLKRYISAKRVVVFSDACHSGAISVNFTTRGLADSEPNLVNQYLADLSKTKEGIVIFTASAAGEVSQEFPDMGHGAFTFYLLEGLEGKADFNNDYTVTINELMQYVEEQVKRKTHGAQNPTRSQTEYDKELTISTVPH
ncbi:MAG: caspase family protein [Ignavibacteriales bacterium]|nr:caspase family protein [Ignavibacteriales bacterium]